MCGRYARRSDKEKIAELFAIAGPALPDFGPPWNVTRASASFGSDYCWIWLSACRAAFCAAVFVLRCNIVPHFSRSEQNAVHDGRRRGGQSRAFNLGTGEGHSVQEVIASVERVSSRRIATRESPRRPGDPPILSADSRAAREVLGWNPAYSDLEFIVESAWQWHWPRVMAICS
jgi:hypothetical protein